MAASFSACGKCGVRLSAPSMAYHQQMCGKVREGNNGGVPQQGGVVIQSHSNDPTDSIMRPTSGSAVLGPLTPGSQQQRLNRDELNALRQEVYLGSGTTPAAQREHGHHGHHSQHALQRGPADALNTSFGSEEATRGPTRSGRKRASSRQLGEGRSPRAASSGGATSSSSSAFVNTLAGRLEDLMDAFEEHGDYCRREFIHVENALTRQQKAQQTSTNTHKMVEELAAAVQSLREDLRVAADEMLMTRRDLKVVTDENAKLREEVRKLKGGATTNIADGVLAADNDFIDLKGEVNRLRGLLESSQRESQQHLRDMRTIRDECMDEATSSKRDVRILGRDIEALREEMDGLRKRGPEPGPAIASRAGAKSVALTIQHHGAPTATTLPRRSPSGSSTLPPRQATARHSERSTSGDYLTADDSESPFQGSATSAYQRQPSSHTQQKSRYHHHASNSITDNLDTSVQVMHRDTENMITRAMQHKRPAAVVSSRSLSRGHDDDDSYRTGAGTSVSPEQRSHIPVAHASLRDFGGR